MPIKEIDVDQLGAGTQWLSPEEMDTRDFVAGDVVGLPYDDVLDKQITINLTKLIRATEDQGCIPSCTANALCHIVEIQNIIDYGTQLVDVDHRDQWVNNQKKVWACEGNGDYLERAIHSLLKNGVSGSVDLKKKRFRIDGYMYESWKQLEFAKMLQLLAYRIKKENRPIYCAFRGNRDISIQITKGEWDKVISLQDTTYGHAVALVGVDFEKRYVHFINSWNWNMENKDKNKLISTFKISFDVFEKLINNGIFGWRYFLTFDQKDIMEDKLFVDYATPKDPEHAAAVKRAKEKGIIKGVPSDLGMKLEPHRPVTRLEMILALYRQSQQ